MLRNPFRSVLATSLALGLAAPVVFAGDLAPPGPPSGTMKTLDQVEPRIPIGPLTTPGDADSVYRITQPGSYYFTSDLVVPAGDGRNGVIVAASDVTIDLEGFAIVGGGLGATGGPALNAGVSVASGERLTLRNGTIRNFQDFGAHTIGSDGSRIERLTVEGVGHTGLFVGQDSIIRECIVRACGVTGVVAGNGRGVVITDTVAFGNGDNGFMLHAGATLEGCIARGNTGAGFEVYAFSNDRAATFRGCTADENGESGFVTLEMADAVFDGCAASNNGGNGFRATRSAAVHRSVAYDNNLDGINITLGGVVTGVEATGNGSAGVRVGAGGLVADTIARQNQYGVIAGAYATVQRVAISGSLLTGVSLATGASLIDSTIGSSLQTGVIGSGGVLIDSCVILGNQGHGVSVVEASIVRNCLVRQNMLDGVRAASKATIADNTVELNGNGGLGAGIRVTGEGNRIEGNTITQNGDGVATGDNRNLIARNTFYLNSVNLNLAVGQTATTSSTPATAGPWDNILQ